MELVLVLLMKSTLANERTAAERPSVLRWLGDWTAAALATAQPNAPRGMFGILMYHRIVNSVPNLTVPTWNVSPQQFRQQMLGLLQKNYSAWPLRHVLEYQTQKKPIPPRVFVVTFDDAYESVFTQAFPVLYELKIPATVFLSTAYVDSNDPFPNDDWSDKGSNLISADAWRPLRRAQCLEMQRSHLIDFGAHTHTHADFRQRPNSLREDLFCNISQLQNMLGIDSVAIPFAFPYGTKASGFADAELARVVQQVGLTCALNTEPVLASLQSSSFDWGRFNVEASDTAAILTGKLSGWFNYMKSHSKTTLNAIKSWGSMTFPKSAPQRLPAGSK
jgi:peptidoglycan/xylan/chitin deacetylase (PgdA/CDA1 family)